MYFAYFRKCSIDWVTLHGFLVRHHFKWFFIYILQNVNALNIEHCLHGIHEHSMEWYKAKIILENVTDFKNIIIDGYIKRIFLFDAGFSGILNVRIYC